MEMKSGIISNPFPNYFPPSEIYGTEEELADAIGHITNDLRSDVPAATEYILLYRGQ